MNSVNLYRRVIGYYRPYLGTICFSLILLVVGVNFSLLKYWPIRWVMDQFVKVRTGGDVHWQGFAFTPGHAALFAAAAMVVIYLLAGLLAFWRNYVSIEIGLKALLQLRTQLYSYLQYLPLHFHDRRRSGDSTFRVAYDSQAIQTFYNRGFDTIFGSVITLLTTYLYMASMDAVLAGISLLILPLLWLTIYFFSARVRRQTTALQQGESDVLARASEGLTSIRIVHAFGQEEYEVREFEREARQSYAANLNLTITNAISTLAISGVMALGLSVVLYVAALHILDGRLTVGELFLFGTIELHRLGARGRGGRHAARLRNPRCGRFRAGNAGRAADAARDGADRFRERRLRVRRKSSHPARHHARDKSRTNRRAGGRHGRRQDDHALARPALLRSEFRPRFDRWM
jgi:ATP-binding cassette subfamily B protein